VHATTLAQHGERSVTTLPQRLHTSLVAIVFGEYTYMERMGQGCAAHESRLLRGSMFEVHMQKPLLETR
jgi:hypothetical protein